MIFQLIVGLIMMAVSYQAQDRFSAILFIEGMIIVNFSIAKFSKGKGLSHV
jgi:hypothetical protein